MTGGPRYWNEDSQRWEETVAGPPGAVPAPPGTDPAGTAPAGPPAPDITPPARSAGAAPAAGAGPGVRPPADGVAGAGAATAAGTAPGAPAGTGGAGAPVGVPRPGASPSAPTLTGVQWAGAQPPPPWPAPEPYGPARPPGAPVAVPDGPRGGGRRRVWAVVGGAAVVGVVAGLVFTPVLRDGGKGTDDKAATPASASRAPEPSTSTGPEETPSTEETASPSGLPAPYQPYADPQGFTLDLPAGWSRTTVSSRHGIDVVNYRAPDGGRRLQIFEVSEPSPGESHALFLSDDVAKAPGFTELSLENLDDGDFTGSRLEYLVDSLEGEPDVGTWHVVDERFVAADGRIYAIAAYGADADGRDDERELLRTALGRFCPPDTVCGTDTP
ncbi:hypothetical protein ACH4VX_10285 [Streptomyces sp. NPDC020731]|uniref:hypothetical protein n=1 Tax=Streptomyces sp. NPDC020731 TaxID=3365085 RepID=UPI0037B3237E